MLSSGLVDSRALDALKRIELGVMNIDIEFCLGKFGSVSMRAYNAKVSKAQQGRVDEHGGRCKDFDSSYNTNIRNLTASPHSLNAWILQIVSNEKGVRLWLSPC